jgi:ligand-binding sensor domain-containing protein
MRIFLILLLLFPFCAFAQGSREYAFKHFSTANGLASNSTNAIIQDKDGFIWIASDNGLQRYDGSSFLTFEYKPNNPSSLPSDKITDLFYDKKNNLWVIANNHTLGRFDTRRFTFKEIKAPKKDDRLYTRFLEAHSGELLLVQSKGALLKWNEKKDEFVEDEEIIPIPKGWTRRGIVWDAAQKKYWMNSDSGLVQYDPYTKHLNYKNHNVDHNSVIERFKNLIGPIEVFLDAQNNPVVWYWPPLTGAPTVFRYNLFNNTVDTLVFATQLGYHEIKGIMHQRNKRLWLYGMSFLAEWKAGSKSLVVVPNEYRNEQSMRFDNAFDAYEDRESNIWLATDNGVFMFNPDEQVFNTYLLERPGQKPFEAPVQAVAEKNGVLFIGCWAVGVYCYDKDMNALPLPKGMEAAKRFSVWDMEVNEKSGNLWITLQRGGMAIYDFQKQKMSTIFPDVFAKSTIRQIDQDTSGNIWFGTHNGRVIKWDYKKSNGDPTKGYELVYETSMVHKVHYDYSGFMWVATIADGLLKFDARTNKLVKKFTVNGPEGERLFTNAPGDITYYNDSTLLVSAGCINVINTRTNKVSFIGKPDGLPENATMSLQKDRNGIVWVGMSSGICRVNIEKKIISYYDRRQGISTDRFSMAGVDQLLDGRMIFFTDHNFLVFDPQKFMKEKNPPKPFFTSVSIAGNSLPTDSLEKADKVTLKYNNTSFAISFSALSFLPQRKLHYLYMLQGVDKQWRHSDGPTEAVYNFLAPGDYIFKVMSENADGVTSVVTEIPVVVTPPIYKTWWFYSLMLLDVILVLYLIDRERMKKIRSMQQLRMQIAGNLHSEINTALSNINVLSEIAKIKADKNVEQSKEFIDQISDKSRYMIESMDDMLWSIHPENDSMRKTLARIKEVTEGLNADYDVDIDLIIDHKLQSLELSMKVRHELYFFYKEAMTFLVQNSSCNQKFVNINLVRSKLKMEILSECGKDDPDFSDQFRKAVQRRVTNMNASLDILSDSSGFSAVLCVIVR